MRYSSVLMLVALASFLSLQGCGGGGTTSGTDGNVANGNGADGTIVTHKGCPLTFDDSSNLVLSNTGDSYIFDFKGTAADGNYTDYFVCTYYDSGILESEFPKDADDQISGTAKGYYESGKVEYVYPFIDNLENGIFKSYYESGALEQTVPYTDGKVNGIRRIYLEDGTLVRETPYIDDKKYGMKKIYDDQGALIGCTNYLNDTDTGSCLGHKGCPLTYDATYDLNASDTNYYYTFDFQAQDEDNNYVDNFFCSYYDKGALESETPFNASYELNGIMRGYYESGAVKYETPYINGVEDGDSKGYDESGNMTYCHTYVNGEDTGSCMP